MFAFFAGQWRKGRGGGGVIGKDRMPHVSLEKENDNFCVEFTYSIKRACEIRKFHVAVVQRRQRNVQNSVMPSKVVVLLIKTYLPFSLPSRSLLVLLSSRNSATKVT